MPGKTRRLVQWLGTLACLWSAALVLGAQSRPNILLMVADDTGYGDVSAHGHPILRTPHLDRLHHESVRFTDFHVSPTCAPTRSALLTGRHEFKNGVTHTILERERLTPRAVTIAQVLQRAGYATGSLESGIRAMNPRTSRGSAALRRCSSTGAAALVKLTPAPAVMLPAILILIRPFCTMDVSSVPKVFAPTFLLPRRLLGWSR